jgi:hypothetical protein
MINSFEMCKTSVAGKVFWQILINPTFKNWQNLISFLQDLLESIYTLAWLHLDLLVVVEKKQI